MSEKFEVKDSGARKQFDSGMVRDTAEGKVNFLLVRPGPMLRRWALHLTKAEAKYPPPEIGVPNWTLANGPEELDRFRQSAARHFESWLNGETDEDHAAGVIFNINGAEYVKEKLTKEELQSDEFFFMGERMTLLPCNTVRMFVIAEATLTAFGLSYSPTLDGYVRS